MNGPDWTYWLQMMNFAMVAVVVLAGLTVCIAIAWELRERKVRHAGEARGLDEEVSTMLRAEPHRIAVAELGLTMADGGEELEASDRGPDDEKSGRK